MMRLILLAGLVLCGVANAQPIPASPCTDRACTYSQAQTFTTLSASSTATVPTAAAGTNTTQAASTAFAMAIPTPGYLFGLTLSNDGSTPNTVLDISAGSGADSTNAVKITLGAFTKSTGGVWAAGSAGNGMGTGLTIANSTSYHVFAIINAGAADVYFDTSATAANKPAGTTYFRRIGSFLTDGSAHILPCSWLGDEVLLLTPINSVSGLSVGTSPQLVSTGVPTGVQLQALMAASMTSDSNQIAVLFNSPDQTAVSVGTGGNYLISPAANNYAAGQFRIRTNTSGQIRVVSTATTQSCVVNVFTQGWVDRRGRLF